MEESKEWWEDHEAIKWWNDLPLEKKHNKVFYTCSGVKSTFEFEIEDIINIWEKEVCGKDID
jgi:hypothetical protein